MFEANTSFRRFIGALKDRLDPGLTPEYVSDKICVLAPEGTPIRLFCYLAGAGHRIAVDGGGRSIHIDEDMWVTRPAVLLSRIAALAGQVARIHARDTVMARLEKRIALLFQDEHHLQVALPGKYRYGLYHNGELVAAAVFSGGRRMVGKPDRYRSYELLRFCHKQGVHVVGGFSKLLNGLRRDFNPGDIMTYADKDWSDGDSYRKTGFEIVGETAPQQFWVDRHAMQRYYERTLPLEIREKPADERLRAGYAGVYNSGSIKLVKVYPDGPL